MRIRSISSLALSMTVVACSIRPLPDDVTRDTTVEIINKIRCETRDALVARMIAVLEEPAPNSLEPSTTNMSLLNKLEREGTSAAVLCNLSPAEFDPIATARLNKFRTAATQYDFDFTIEENKIKKGGATFKVPIFKGTFTLGLSAGSDKKRKNQREIVFVDTFSSLMFGRYSSGELTGLDCGFVDQPRKHWIYPITGNIGILEVIGTFIDLAKITQKVKTFRDTLTFTTALNVSAKPSIALTRLIPKKLNLTDANIDYTASRSDAHQVKLTLNIPEPPAPPEPKKDIAFYKLFDNTETGMPKGSSFGFAVEAPVVSSKKDSGTKPVGCRILREQIPIVKIVKGKVVREMGNPFALSAQEEKASIDQVIRESQRLDSKIRNEAVDELIRLR